MKFILSILSSFLIFSALQSQDPHRFDQEIDKFRAMEKLTGSNTAVFTGSSSVRMWQTLSEDCPNYTLVNTGFGGSHMSDLLYFIDETVLKFNPQKVFIYEGDNDISADKSPKDVMTTTRLVVEILFTFNPEIEIYFISAKPSPSRWSFEKQYLTFNTMLETYCASHNQIHYIDVWDAMLNENGRPMPDIFIADSLHMKPKGYAIWKNIICK